MPRALDTLGTHSIFLQRSALGMAVWILPFEMPVWKRRSWDSYPLEKFETKSGLLQT